MKARSLFVCVLFLFTFLFAVGARPVNSVAVDGYDVVAYFTGGKAIEGKKEHSAEWNGATWRFASAAHQEAFIANPEKYAPQYGGYCAFGVSRGYAVGADPHAWTIVDGKLYLNYNADVQKEWAKDVAGSIRKADANWPKVLAGE